jgi:hypothetical protein
MTAKQVTKHFKSPEAYRRWTAYGHIHNVFKEKEPGERIIIAGKEHKVLHDFKVKKK